MNVKNSIGIDAEALVVGSRLQYPLYSDGGALLLSQGATVTSEVKRGLADHGIQRVQIHQDDAARLFGDSKPEEKDSEEKDPPEQVDSQLDSELFCYENTGPAFRNRMVIHGCKAYDRQLRKQLSLEHRNSSKALSFLMRKAVQGGAVDAEDVRRVTTANMEHMTGDCENVITAALEVADKGVSEQSLQTALLGMAIGIELGLDVDNVRILGAAGLVSDWGMMQLPEDIRGIKGQFSETELFEIQKVPMLTANMLQKATGLPRLVLPIAYQLHEKLDGSGYPRGRDANGIHPFAKILHVADLYTALTAPGPARNAAMPYAAMESLVREAAKKAVDVNVVRALLQVMSLFPIGSYVSLSDGSVARVLRRNAVNYACPIVQVIQDAYGKEIAPDNEDTIIIPSEVGIKITQALPKPRQNQLSAAEPLQPA